LAKLHLQKYLERHAEPSARNIDLSLFAEAEEKPWNRVVVVPCYHDADMLPEFLRSMDESARHCEVRALAIFVVNGKVADGPELHAKNQRTIALLKKQKATLIGPALETPDITLAKHPDSSTDYLIVDCASGAALFPETEGVGLARKIGCDLAVRLSADGLVSTPWIRTTDCDVIVTPEFFTEQNSRDAVALVASFRHVPVLEDELSWQALQLYEKFLFYYEAGLRKASSPYAFQTIGSTISVRAESYCQVRGFPKRLAAEDFYILNKLSKVGKVKQEPGPPTILIRDRHSARVPFGTGIAVAKICKQLESSEAFTIYDPRSFDLLRTWLDEAKKYLEHGSLARLAADFPLFSTFDGPLNLTVGLLQIREKSSDIKHLERHFHIWFDALKTLRFIHVCRDHFYPEVDHRHVGNYFGPAATFGNLDCGTV
jgi:hypothetical protein